MSEGKTENLGGVIKTTFPSGLTSFQATPHMPLPKIQEYLINCDDNIKLFLTLASFTGVSVEYWGDPTNEYNNYTLRLTQDGEYRGWSHRDYYNSKNCPNHHFTELKATKDYKKILELIKGSWLRLNKVGVVNQSVEPATTVKVNPDIVNKIALPKRDKNGRFISSETKDRKFVRAKPRDDVVKYKIAHFNYEDAYGCMTYNRKVAITRVSNFYLEGYDFARNEHRQFKLDKIFKLKSKFEECDDLPEKYKAEVIADKQYYIGNPHWPVSKYVVVNTNSNHETSVRWDGGTSSQPYGTIHSYYRTPERGWIRVTKEQAENNKK